MTDGAQEVPGVVLCSESQAKGDKRFEAQTDGLQLRHFLGEFIGQQLQMLVVELCQ